MTKKISVIVPCYNAEKYLRRCVNSLTAQTIGIDNLELILVNDASTDCTLDILLEYEKEFPDSVLVINNEQNGRQGYCRNLALSYASGAFIGYMDDDDWADVTMFEKLYMAAVENQCEIAECGTIRTSSEENDIPFYQGIEIFDLSENEKREAFLLNHIQDMYVWHRIYRRDFLEANEICFPVGTFYEDEYFSTLALSYVRRFCKMDEVLHFYFEHPDATSQKGTAGKKEFDGMLVETALLEELRNRGLYEHYSEYYDFRFLVKYYIEGLLRVFRKLDKVTEETLRNVSLMQKTILILYPHFSENRYYLSATLELHRIIMNSVYTSFTEESLAEFQKEVLLLFEQSRS